jgi:CRP-like cAMP-binding protein
MISDLVEFLSRYLPIPSDLAEALDKSDLVREFPRGTALLRQGDRAARAFFILRGCVRSFALKDGDDRTIDFFVEEDTVMPLEYGAGGPSSHFLECLEDTVAVVSTPDQEERMLSEYPQLKSICLTMSEVMAGKLQESLARFRISTPEERYRELAEKRPTLLNRVPQYQIASYLGVRPESLSRIRRRIAARGGDLASSERS